MLPEDPTPFQSNEPDCRPPSVDIIRRPAFIDEGLYDSDSDLAIEDLVDAANDLLQRMIYSSSRPSEQLLRLYECVVACAESIDLSDHVFEDLKNYITKWNRILK